MLAEITALVLLSVRPWIMPDELTAVPNNPVPWITPVELRFAEITVLVLLSVRPCTSPDELMLAEITPAVLDNVCP